VSVTFASGFRAGSVASGLKSSGKLDVTVVQNLGPNYSAAAVFTTNRAKANPVLWSEQAIKDNQARAVVLNSGGANCYTGSAGFQVTHKSAELVANLLDCSSQDVLVCSTGLIGVSLDSAKLFQGIESACSNLSSGGGDESALAIMTTDTVPKLASESSAAGWKIGGMAKGAGMLAPALATMLCVITTDAKIDGEIADRALREATRLSFDRLDSDGCTSTNDTVILLSSGASGVCPDSSEFQELLIRLCKDLARQLMKDAEGASHEITIEVHGAASEDDALLVGRAIARNNLFKAAIYGNDPNWGRILAAIGTTDASFDPYNIDVEINGVRVCSSGGPDKNSSLVDLQPREVLIRVGLNSGEFSASIWTNDLTKEYVIENSEYSS
jgi:glutamate N-acetyltransferase / amino-acid N-acetyltransferase